MKPRTFPLVTGALVAANLAVYAAELAGDGQALCQADGLVPAHFEPGAIFTAMFLHDPSGLAHIGGNMVFLAIFGTIVERAFGHVRFAALYLAAGIVGALTHVLVHPAATDAMVGASGAIFGVLAVGAALRSRLLPFVAVFFACQLWGVFAGASDVAFGAHIGGFVVGVFVAALAQERSLHAEVS